MSKNPLTWLLVSTPACTPDAQIAELPLEALQYSPPKKVAAIHRRTESAPLLGDDPSDCNQCSRKRRRLSFDAYPTTLPTLPEYVLQPRRRPRERGCKRLFIELKHAAICYCTSKRRYQILTRYRYSKQKKPFTAISVHVEQLTSETYEEDDLAGIPDLLEVVKLQATGPSEVARSLRKKLKYGSVHRQLRALTILDGLLQNGGQRLQRAILQDPPLQERLRIAAIDPMSDQEVQTKCRSLFGQWVASATQQPGLEGAKSLYNQLPKKKQQTVQQRRDQSKVLRETEEAAMRDEEEEMRRVRASSITEAAPSHSRQKSNPISLSSSSTWGTNKVKKDKKNKSKIFNLEKERPAILQAIAGSSVASSNLNNAMKLVNRENQRVSDNQECLKRFETCKNLRRQILRYIQFVETEELLGGLIDANERLIGSLMAYEVMDKSMEDDSDSEMEEAAHLSRREKQREDAAIRDAEKRFATMDMNPPSKPPRPTSIPMPPRAPAVTKTKPAESEESDTDYDSDDDDPFADKNAAKTPDPSMRTGYTWKEV
ncbi:hypothetical protein PMZ80_000013 [Knufia obscura]|uniref:VHS domain-containing protein n=2 Tax=Knufia TaxID=430999 RepID=A0AAN8E9X4_9EURO|nr:hypothetical protein PMZ80_000013 [Knufia obscura]KAK5948805.1 hypothetical protein OHC33_010229 [Knufia fluminis]